MSKKKQQLIDIVYDIYRELYKESTPSADFDELLASAPINEQGQKVIDFMSYYISKDSMRDIIERHCKSNKLNKLESKNVSLSVYLGCSPTSNKPEGHD